MLPGVAGASLRRAIVISEVAFGSEFSVRLQDSSAGRRRYTFQPARNSAPTSAAPRIIRIIVMIALWSSRRDKSKTPASHIFITPNRYYERLPCLGQFA